VSDVSVLRALATTPASALRVALRYDDALQVTEVFENGEWVKSWDSLTSVGTKKEDHERGEDVKGL
jgi:hypothetical protein